MIDFRRFGIEESEDRGGFGSERAPKHEEEERRLVRSAVQVQKPTENNENYIRKALVFRRGREPPHVLKEVPELGRRPGGKGKAVLEPPRLVQGLQSQLVVVDQPDLPSLP